MTAALAGLGLGFSLIVAIGAQNLFVLRQGIRREHVFAVVLTCALSDAVLIAVGVAGLGAATTALPWLAGAVRWVGAAFLIGYGLLAASRAIHPSVTADGREQPEPRTLSAVLAACLAFTWLNPHVYLDTVFLLGSVASTFGEARWLFAAGATAASFTWFFGLGYGAGLLTRWLARPSAARWLDAFVAVVMLTLGVSLVLGH